MPPRGSTGTAAPSQPLYDAAPAGGDIDWEPSVKSTTFECPARDEQDLGRAQFMDLVAALVTEYDRVAGASWSPVWDEAGTNGINSSQVSVSRQGLEIESVSKTVNLGERSGRAWTRFTEHLVERAAEMDSGYMLRDFWIPRATQDTFSYRSSKSTSMVVSFFGELAEGQPGEDALDDVVRQAWHKSRPRRRNKEAWGSVTLYRRKRCANYESCIIHPDCWQRVLWACFGLLFVFCDVLFLTMSIFGVGRLKWLDLLDCCYWTIDVGFIFFIGYYSGSGIEMDPSKVARHYVRTWFLPDLMLLAYQWPATLVDSGTVDVGFVRYFRLARYTKLLRVFKVKKSFRDATARIHSEIVVLLGNMAGWMFGMLVWVHASASAFFWIGLASEEGWVQQDEQNTMFPYNYVISLQWSGAQLQGGGADIVEVVTLPERLFAALHVLLSVVVVSVLVGKLTNKMLLMQQSRQERGRLVQIAHRYLESYQITSQVAPFLIGYCVQMQTVSGRQNEAGEEQELLERLPGHLRRNLLEEARWPALRRHVLFAAASQLNARFMRRVLCDVVTSVAFLPDEQVFGHGTLAKAMYNLVKGEGCYEKASMFTDRIRYDPEGTEDPEVEEILRRLDLLYKRDVREGTALSEATLFTATWAHLGDLQATRPSVFYVIDAQQFGDLVSVHVHIQSAMSAHAYRFARFLNDATNKTDFLGSETVMEAEVPHDRSPRSMNSSFSETLSSLDPRAAVTRCEDCKASHTKGMRA